jgi:hypothetical protein
MQKRFVELKKVMKFLSRSFRLKTKNIKTQDSGEFPESFCELNVYLSLKWPNLTLILIMALKDD